MATTTDVQPQVRMIALEQIRHDANVREHATEDIDAIAGSIALLGQITPAIVRPDGDGYLLVAGHKRYAALQQLGHSEIRAEVRSGESEHSERAAENVVRTQLNPYEEAGAVAAMLAHGLTEDGAAQALGWPKARVTARMRLLELPETAQQMVGAGEIALSSVEQLRAIGHVAPALLDTLIAYLADGNQWAAERLAREPGWVLDAALRESDNKVFAAHLSRIDSHDIAALRLGKKTDALYEQAVELARQLDRYSYGADIRFTDTDVDQARAAGVVIEFERGWPLIVDRSLYRELVKQAIARTVGELEARVADRTAEKQAQRRATAPLPGDPAAEARREEQRAMRQIAETAHGVNLDLGAGLLTGLSTVDPADMTVARFFVYALLGSDYDDSSYTQTGDRVARLAVSGIRLVIGDFRTDVTKTLQSGARGKLRIDYGDPREPQDPIKWMWRFIDGAKSAGELYGRALVVICAEQYASRLVVPTSQRTPPTSWDSHKDRARKALTKLASPHLPTSLKQLEKAIAQTHADHDRAITRTRDQPAALAGNLTPDDQTDSEIDDDTVDDPDDGQGRPEQQAGD